MAVAKMLCAWWAMGFESPTLCFGNKELEQELEGEPEIDNNSMGMVVPPDKMDNDGHIGAELTVECKGEPITATVKQQKLPNARRPRRCRHQAHRNVGPDIQKLWQERALQ